MKNITILIFVAALLIPAFAGAQQDGRYEYGNLDKVGTTSAAFLRIPIGARAVGVGGAYSAVVEDPTALYWNPAGITDLKGINISFSRIDLYAGIEHSFLGMTYNLQDMGTLGLSVIYLSSGGIEVTTVDQPEGTGYTYSVDNLAIGASFARHITPWFKFGFTGKYIQEEIYTEKAQSFAFDLGSVFDTKLHGIRLGMSISNFGKDMSFKGPASSYVFPNDSSNPDLGYEPEVIAKTQSSSLPMIFRGGVMVDLIGGLSPHYPSDLHQLTVMGDFDDGIDSSPRGSIGAEYVWNKMASLRGGYKLNYDVYSYSVGVGFHYTIDDLTTIIDYAIADYGDLGIIHYVTISLGM